MSKAASTRLANNERLVRQWNALYPIGTPVTVSRGIGRPIETKTASNAQLEAGYPVIFVEYDSHAVSLTRVRPAK